MESVPVPPDFTLSVVVPVYNEEQTLAVIIQDTDLEYDLFGHPQLLAPILASKAGVIFGLRFMGGAPYCES